MRRGDVHRGDALVDHGPRASIAVLVCQRIGGPVADMVALAAYDNRQQRPVGLSLGASPGAHSLESVEHLGKLLLEDGIKLSLRPTSINQARIETQIAHLGHPVSEHIYAVRQRPADHLISLQAFDHHLRQVRNHLSTTNVML